ncbi:collagen binding domain-containing protein, partial [Bacillus pumilus]
AMNPSEITWTVDFNMGERMLTDALFKDTLPAGLELAPASIEVHELEVQLDGSLVEDQDPFTGYEKTNDSLSGFELKFNGSSDSAYRVHYKTKITQTTD